MTSQVASHAPDMDFMEHLNTIQNIIDSWIALLDAKTYRHRIPDPLNYLSIIVMGDEQSGKTSLIESLLGVQLKYCVYEHEPEELSGQGSGLICDSDSNSGQAIKTRNGGEYQNYDESVESESLMGSKQFAPDHLRKPRRVCSSYSTSISPSIGRPPLSPAVPPLNYVPQTYTDYSRPLMPSPRSCTSTVSRVMTRGRASVINLKKKHPSCLATVISLKRGSEAYFIAVPLRASINASIIVQDAMMKALANNSFNNTGVAPDCGLFSARVHTSNVTLNPQSLLSHMEKTFGHSIEYAHALNLFRYAVEQEEIVEIHYVMSPLNKAPSAIESRRQSIIKPGTRMEHNLPAPFYMPPLTESSTVGAQQGFPNNSVGRNNSIIAPRTNFRTKSSIAYVSQPLRKVDHITFIQFQLATLRCLPYLIEFARLLESIADSTESMAQTFQEKSAEPETHRDEVIQIQITGPKLPNIRVIEVPGGVSDTQNTEECKASGSPTANMSQPVLKSNNAFGSNKLRERAKIILREYALNRNALFVNVIDASQTMHSYFSKVKAKSKMPDSLRWIVELEPQGTRTLIVLSKLDLVRNFGQLVTSLVAEAMPWGKDYERRASAMFYKRYFSQPSVQDKSSSGVIRSRATTLSTVDTASPKSAKPPLPRRLSFRRLGLHHPKVVCLSFLNQVKSVFREVPVFACESNDIPMATGDLFKKFLNYEKDYLAQFQSIMSDRFSTYFGFKCLTESLIATVCMTIGSQCMEPAAIVITREKKRLDKRLEAEIQRTNISSPSERFEESMAKFRGQITLLLSTDPEVLQRWTKINQIENETQLDEHMLASSAPLAVVLSSAAGETEQKLFSLDEISVLNEYYRGTGKKKWSEQVEEKMSYQRLQAVLIQQVGKEDYLKEKLRIVVDSCRLEFERMLKRCGSYLKTCIQAFIRSSFNPEYFTEDQLLSAQAIVTGLYQTRVLLIRKELRTRCEDFLLEMLERIATSRKRSSTGSPFISAHGENLLENYKGHWNDFFNSMIEYLVTSFTNFKDILLLKEETDQSSTESTNEWLDSLKRVFLTNTPQKTYNARVEQLMVRVSLFQRVMEQLEAYIGRYPLLYHFCIASVTLSQIDHQAMADKARGDLVDLDMQSKIDELSQVVDSANKLDETKNDKLDAAGMINAKTLSYICSGSIGAALLYSLAKK